MDNRFITEFHKIKEEKGLDTIDDEQMLEIAILTGYRIGWNDCAATFDKTIAEVIKNV